MEEFKPKFLTQEERAKLREALPKPPVKSSVSPVKSRSHSAIEEKDLKFEVPKRAKIDIEKYRSTFRFEWDTSDDTEADSIRMAPTSFRSQKGLKEEESNINKKPLNLMTQRDWKILKENYFIETKNTQILPFRNWDESNLPRLLKQNLRYLRYNFPTAIQMQGIPVSQSKADMIGISYTGSGKSASFLLPIIQHCLSLPVLDFESARDGPYALVLSPTRELAQQLDEECRVLMEGSDLRTYCIVGGKNIETQRTELTNGAEVIVATPGRLLDMLKISYIVLNQCAWVVVDEADKVFLLELTEAIKEIFSCFPPENWKKAVLQVFSATIDPQVEAFWRGYLKNPAVVRISDFSRRITQNFEFLEAESKKSAVKKLLKEVEKPILVFVNEKIVADNLKNILQDKWKVASLHGDRLQEQRETITDQFREGRLEILITTDVFSRGINIKSLKTVINYDCPKSIIDYEHRIGRTGRMGQKGTSVTFITPSDTQLLPSLVSYLQKTRQKIPDSLQSYLHSYKQSTEIIE